MKQIFMIAAIAATWVAASPSQAEQVAADLLPPQEVASIVASIGLRVVDRPLWRNGRYVVHAVDRYGREMRVVIDAQAGHVLAVRPSDHRFAERRYELNGSPYTDPRYGRDERFGSEPRFEKEPRYSTPRDEYDRRYASPGRYPQAEGYDRRFEDGISRPPAPRGSYEDDEEDLYEDDKQHSSLAPAPEEPRAVPPSRESTRTTIKPQAPASSSNYRKDAPLPRSRPALANARGDEKIETKKDVRIIDLSKPKPTAKAEDTPGEAIRF